MNRSEALESGYKTYTAGKPCKWGHLGPRITATGGCVECNRQRARSVRLRDAQAQLSAAGGLVTVGDMVRVHPDDMPGLQTVADSLNYRRGIYTVRGGLQVVGAPDAWRALYGDGAPYAGAAHAPPMPEYAPGLLPPDKPGGLPRVPHWGTV